MQYYFVNDAEKDDKLFVCHTVRVTRMARASD
jgi:hypothetical protein